MLARAHPHEVTNRIAALACVGAMSAIATSVIACAESAPPAAVACDSPALAVIAASDYSSSEIVILRAPSDPPVGAGGASIGPPTIGVDLGGDPVLSVSQGRCFFVARDLDLLVELDPACGAPIRKIATGDGASSDNPQDVAATNDGSLFVPKFRTGDVVVLRPSGARDVVHLASFDPDGNPNPSSATTVVTNGAEKIWVTLERLDDKTLLPGALPSLVVRVDPVSLAVDAQVTLVGADPFGLAVSFGGALFYAEPGHFDSIAEANAGVERVDPATMQSALVVREKDLGGSVAQVAVTDGCAAAIVADASKVNATSLATFDPTTGNVHTTASTSLLRSPGYDLEGLAFTQGVLYVGDRRRAQTGYPIHAFTVGDGCLLTALPDTLFSPQKPVAIRSPR